MVDIVSLETSAKSVQYCTLTSMFIMLMTFTNFSVFIELRNKIKVVVSSLWNIWSLLVVKVTYVTYTMGWKKRDDRPWSM